MYFKTYYLGCLSHASYLIGGNNHEGVVIDPRRDIDEYIADAEAAGLKVTHVIETHLHADFVSGHLELARRTGATVYMGAAANAAFPHHPVKDGEIITLGDVTLRFLETPGHTPESITILAESTDSSEPVRLFTGDTLFVGDVGRPDLAGGRGFTADQMARQLFNSLSKKILAMPDTVEIWPAHGAGSSCGRCLSDERSSTLGTERLFNPALALVAACDEEGFVHYATEGLSTAPSYFTFDAEKNREGAKGVAEIIGDAKPLSPAIVEQLSEDEALVLDTRSIADFGAGHVPGSVHVQLDGKFAPWAGTLIDPETPLIIVSYPNRRDETMMRLARIGYERIVGWLEGGMEAWISACGDVATVEQLSPEALKIAPKTGGGSVLDVRTDGEWEAGHLDGAIHIPLPQLRDRASELPAGPVLVMCGTGYRSSIACSLLQRSGRHEVSNVTGGWDAWKDLN